MLRFMYSFDYNNAYGTSTMVFDAQVYQIADKYGMESLKTHAQEKFRNAITTSWGMDDFPLAISIVYGSTPEQDRGLRDLTVEVSLKNIDKLLGRDDFHALLKSTADFAADLIPFLANKPQPQVPLQVLKQYHCPNCGETIQGDYSKGQYYCPSCGSRRSDWRHHLVSKMDL
jgi:speckle-type POZ protein